MDETKDVFEYIISNGKDFFHTTEALDVDYTDREEWVYQDVDTSHYQLEYGVNILKDQKNE